MEQEKLSHIFEEEFRERTSLKVLWICLAVMVAAFLALCATVFYLENGSAAKVLSGKEQLMANVWGRVFTVIAVTPVVIILFMYGFAALIGGLSVLAEKKKRKQAAIPGAPQIQEQSKDSVVAATKQTAQVEPEKSKAAEQEQKVPAAQAEESPVQPEPIVQEPVVEQAETVESEDTQKEETPVPQAEESPTQPEPTVQEPEEEQPKATTEESSDEQTGDLEQEKTDASDNNGNLPKQGPHAITHREDQGDEYPVIIDRDKFREHFIEGFVRTAFGSNHNSFDILCDQLEARSWTTTDLCRIGLFILESKVVKGSMKFSKWLPLFFKLMNREKDCPVKAIPSNYSDFRKSGINFKRDFSDLYRLYLSHSQTTITFKP